MCRFYFCLVSRKKDRKRNAGHIVPACVRVKRICICGRCHVKPGGSLISRTSTQGKTSRDCVCPRSLFFLVGEVARCARGCDTRGSDATPRFISLVFLHFAPSNSIFYVYSRYHEKKTRLAVPPFPKHVPRLSS